jgi:hypothetical protein
VIEKCIRREILMLKPRQHIPKSVTIIQIIGLSFDEPGRVLRTRTRFEAGNPRFRAEFPLFDGGITRQDCMDWLAKVVPHEVPRSACVFCPYHDNREWARIKLEDPAGWARAVEVDKSLRIAGNVVNRNMDRAMFVHRQCVPLDQADLTVPDRPKREAHPDLFRTMAHECSGMCGL